MWTTASGRCWKCDVLDGYFSRLLRWLPAWSVAFSSITFPFSSPVPKISVLLSFSVRYHPPLLLIYLNLCSADYATRRTLVLVNKLKDGRNKVNSLVHALNDKEAQDKSVQRWISLGCGFLFFLQNISYLLHERPIGRCIYAENVAGHISFLSALFCDLRARLRHWLT